MTQKKTKQTLENTGLTFTKMQGTGNDFIIIDARDKGFPKLDRQLLAQALCRRSTSIGADGLLFIEKAKNSESDFKWDFYNADGSSAEMCGNAARCAARYAYEFNIANKNSTIETGAGLVRTRVKTNNMVEVDMPAPKVIEENVEIPVGEHIKVNIIYIDTGVPHAVKENDDWENDYLLEMGNYLRNHEKFKGTNGANATFYEVTSPSKIQAATYERGVEGITLSCGTGAVAAAFAAVKKGEKAPIEVKVPGGILHVDFDKSLSQATLFGEAIFVCEGSIYPGALL